MEGGDSDIVLVFQLETGIEIQLKLGFELKQCRVQNLQFHQKTSSVCVMSKQKM